MSTTVFCQDGKPAVAPPSKWVVPAHSDSPYNLLPADPSLDSRWVLVERQINAQNDEQFFHRARQVLTSNGADKNSRIAIDYDPGYEAITMHWVKIWRGTNGLDRLDPAKFQPGVPEATDFLFSSKQSVVFPLDDLRPGDIIDYAYSIDGGNPALGGMFAERVPLQLNEPVDRMVTRLLWPPPRKLYVQNHGTQIVPATVYKSNLVEFTWDSLNVPGLRVQPPTPIWYNPYPWVELSEFQKWSDVSQWALGLFTTSASNAVSREMTAKINEIQRLPSLEQRAAAALGFVQEQIRNLGQNSGASEYQATLPSVVFARRYGNCKDKTCLLATMLRALGIDASPMLVSTQARQTLADLHPSPLLFDHAVVRATLNSQTYFLDATAIWERGPLADRSWPEYRYGLVIAPGVTALQVIPPCPVLPKTTETAYFNIGGFEQESAVKIVTVAEGTDAEALREHFATTPRDEVEREFLEAQAKFYPEIRAAGHLQFEDGEQTNRIEITGLYSIPRFWTRQPDDAYYHCRFYPVNVADAMRKPSDSVRTQPMGIDYPVHRISRVEANWMVGWPMQPDNQTVENPAFSFYRTINIVSTNLVLEYDYRTLSDAVTPDAFPTYARQLNAATDYLGCTVVSY